MDHSFEMLCVHFTNQSLKCNIFVFIACDLVQATCFFFSFLRKQAQLVTYFKMVVIGFEQMQQLSLKHCIALVFLRN